MPGIHESVNKLFITSEETEKPEKGELSGILPEWMTGTYLRVGPGKFDFPGDFTVNHWLDGYAILSKFQISTKSIQFEKRFLQSDAYTRSLAASRPVINEFGTKAHSDPNKGFFSRMISAVLPEFTDNDYSTLFKIGPDTFAICDTCFFRRVDPKGLGTGEKCDGNKYFGMNGLSAHPLNDDEGNVWSVGYTLLPSIKFHLIKMPYMSSSKEMLKKAKVVGSMSSRWGGCIAAAHSFGMSKNFVVFVEQPQVVVMSKMASSLIKGDSTVIDWMEWRPEEKNRFCIFNKSTGKFLKTEFMTEESFHFLHFINCYEEENQIVVDIICYGSPNVLDTLYLTKLREGVQEKVDLPHVQRFVIPIIEVLKNSEADVNLVTLQYTKAQAKSKANQITLTPEVLTDLGLELPTMNPKFRFRKYSFAYAAGTFNRSTFDNSICKVDLTKKETIVWRENENYFPGEPMFVANPGGQDEDDGIIISVVTDQRVGHQDFLLFLNAKDMTEISRATFKNHLPSSLHGLFLH